LFGATVAAWVHADVRAGAPAFATGTLWVIACAALLAVGWLLRSAWATPAETRGAAHRDHLSLASVVAVGSAALLAGHSAWQHDRRCLEALGDPSVQLVVRLHDAAAPRAWVRADARSTHPSTASCRVPATMSVASGVAPAGAWVTVRAHRLSSGQVLRLDEAVLTPTGAVDRVHGWRGRTGATIDTLWRDRAPLVRALLIADQHGIAPEVRDRFAVAGLVHVLSISGLHVAIIAGALRTVGAALRMRRSSAELLALMSVGAYVLLLGFPAPATRAASMLTTVMLARRLDRPVHTWTALALGVTVPALDPRVVATLGWQLSAAGMAALVGARTVLRRWRTRPLIAEGVVAAGAWAPLERGWMALRRAGPRLSGWRLQVVQELLVGTMASAITAPLVAWSFGQVSLVAPLSNVLASPVVAFLQLALFLALLLAPLRSVALWVADAATAPLVVLDYIARVASDVPYAAVGVAPGRLTALCMGIMMAALVVSTARRRVWPPLLVGAAALVLALWAPLFARGPGQLELHVIDVGQGDAIALRTPRGRWVLVDAGRVWQGGDAGRRSVVPYIRRRGGELALFALTHPDADHVGGAPSVLDALRPALWWDPGFVHGSDVYRRALLVAERRDIPWRRANAGDSLEIDGVMIRVLGPDSAWTATRTNPNDASLVLMVYHGRVRMLLTGDAETEQEEWLVQRWGDALRATVLKVGHHGSRTSSTEALLDAAQPQIALISVGAGNSYGHPAPSVMDALRAHGADILRTDRDGAIVLRSDGRTVHLETRHTRWTHVVP
jgi:competence protein ComEC